MSRTSFRVNPHSIVCLTVRELLPQSRRHIWSLSDGSRIRIHNHLVWKRTLNHLATALTSLKRKEVLPGKYNFEQLLETGASMEDKNFEIFNGTSFLKQTAPQVVLETYGSFTSSPGKINRRSIVISRKEMTYQQVGTTSIKTSFPGICQESKRYFNSHKMDSIVTVTYLKACVCDGAGTKK